jgi:hypothetical protein
MRNNFILTEEESKRILEMHIKATKNKYLYEQNTPTPGTPTPGTPTPGTPTPGTPTAPTPGTLSSTTRYTTATCQGKKSGCNDKILKLQIRINDECPSNILTTKLVEDGFWGQKSNSAWTQCQSSLKKLRETPSVNNNDTTKNAAQVTNPEQNKPTTISTQTFDSI